jgi:hypothetical protein
LRAKIVNKVLGIKYNVSGEFFIGDRVQGTGDRGWGDMGMGRR